MTETFKKTERISTMQDILKPITGNKMLELKMEIKELREILAQTDDPEKIKAIKRAISDKQTHYNILADRARLQS
jgi:rubrerythrin